MTQISVGAVNPVGLRPEAVFLFGRPIPDHPDFSLRASFQHERVWVQLFGPDSTRLPVDDACFFGSNGLGWAEEYDDESENKRMSEMPDPARLCYVVMNSGYFHDEDPGHDQLVDNGFWKQFLDDLPGAFITASVLIP